PHHARADLGAAAHGRDRPPGSHRPDRRLGQRHIRHDRTTAPRLYDRRARQHRADSYRIRGRTIAVKQIASLLIVSAAFAATPAWAQPAPAAPADCRPQGMFTAPAAYRSVEQLADGRVTFRICAPEANEVRVTSNDIDEAIPMGFRPGSTRGLTMTKDAMGLWTATTSVPVPPD